MAKTPTEPTKPDFFYKPETLMKVFGITSVLMLVFTIWMILDDFGREWKTYQVEFAVLKDKLYAEKIEQAKGEVDEEQINSLKEQIAEAEKNLQSQEEQIEKTERELNNLNTLKTNTGYEAKAAKGVWDVHKYEYEAKYGHYVVEDKVPVTDPKVQEARNALLAELAEVERLKNIANQAEQDYLNKKKELKEFHKTKDELSKQLADVRGDLGRLETAKEESKLTVTKVLRNAPIVDMANPVFRIQQIVLPDIKDDIEFAKSTKVDRCTTCHLGIDNDMFKDAPQPFRTHPKLNVQLASTSPHPMNTIGCTVCHEMRGPSVDFVRSAHTPHSKEQMKEWERKYHWHEMHHVIEKGIPLQYTEGRCQVCHKETEWVPKAQKLNASILTVKSAGCTGCHRVEGWDHLRKPGPSLKRIKGKLTKDFTIKWMRQPTSFNEKARMPQIFHLSNVQSPEFAAYQEAEIFALTEYLYNKSENYEPKYRVALGNAETGKEIFGNVGCLGCHSIDDFPVENQSRWGFAPDLSTVGSKVNAAWLSQWLKEPWHYWDETTMPSLRLSDSEISHLSAYLLGKKNDEFENLDVGTPDIETQKKVLAMYLMRDPKMAPATESKVNEKIASMSNEEIVHALGEKAMGRIGCYGCHDVNGWENIQGIGAELSDWGSKLTKKLDFGLLHLEHTNVAWLDQKLTEPRIFDKGVVKEYLDTLRMPYFGFDDKAKEEVKLWLLGRSALQVKAPAAKELDAREARAEEGMRVIHKYNCQGCHKVDHIFESMPEGHPEFEEHEKNVFRIEGRILAHYEEDETKGPPSLYKEGEKVISDWVYAFLKNPGAQTLRKGLKVRMPTFNFTPKELNTLVEGWANAGEVPFPYMAPQRVNLTNEQINTAKAMFNKLMCANCHTVGQTLSPAEYEEGSRGYAPDLTLAAQRLHRDWLVKWLRDPQQMQPGTRMPGFWPDGGTMLPDVLEGNAEKQMELMADYLIYLGQNRSSRLAE